MTVRERHVFFLVILISGCTALFGWDIHAPGVLSENFMRDISPAPERVALYLDPSLFNYVSKARGGRMADPQTYHVGESLAPMMVEAFQQAFEEFIFLETEPTPSLMRQYGIPRVIIVRIKDFSNRVTLKGQALSLVTESVVLDSGLQEVRRFETRGVSDAKKVFAKTGGPEVNLNAALENNASSLVRYLQDSFRMDREKGHAAS